MSNLMCLLKSFGSNITIQKPALIGLSILWLIGCGVSTDLTKPRKALIADHSSLDKAKTAKIFERSDFKSTYENISIPNLKKHIQYLSSDELGGREPASKGDKMTADYMVSELKKLGLKPGNGDSYLQKVDLLTINSSVSKALEIGDIEFTNTENYVATTRNKKKVIGLENSELVFVGYGINAPEFGWNDYQGLDVKGKTVVILVNDPGYATRDPDVFSGKKMTYYGRWTYKYEEAARQGAKGAIIIHETKPASYGWSVIKNGWTGNQYHLPRSKNSAPVVDVELWIDVYKAQELFAKAGLDFQQEKLHAQTKGFTPISLRMNASVEVTSEFSQSTSNNVVALLPGSENADEHIVYMAHIDHLGTDTSLDGDQIYNGAHDNASGMGGLIEIARAYSALTKNPDRSITFVGAAAEEQGTLGSQYYADNPTVPLSSIAGLINMDSINITGRKQDVSVKGYGMSELEEVLASAAALQNRALSPEPYPERGYYFRSDHFSLAKKGVPGLSVGGGTVALNEVEENINTLISERIGRCYHQLCDEYAEDWGWDGAKEDLQLYYATGYLLSMSDKWPNWYKGTEFRKLRDDMLK